MAVTMDGNTYAEMQHAREEARIEESYEIAIDYLLEKGGCSSCTNYDDCLEEGRIKGCDDFTEDQPVNNCDDFDITQSAYESYGNEQEDY